MERVEKNGSNTSKNNDSERIERMRWMLEQRVPIIGGWMHRRITSALTESALAGNWLAAQSLALVFALHEDEDVRKQAEKTLRKINYATGIDAVWGVWADTRHPELEDIAISYNRPASNPSSVRLLSLLRLDNPSAVTNGSADLVPPLVQACQDGDPLIARRARQVIVNLRNSLSIDILCQMWRTSRDAFLTGVIQEAGYVAEKPAAARVLSALKVTRLEVILHGTAEMVPALVEASQDGDPEIAGRAVQTLPHLQSQPAVDAFCKLWSETRSPLLESALLQAGYRAHHPPQVRILAALKNGHLEIAQKASPQALPHLLEAARDKDATIAENARLALGKLKDVETRDALCSRVIENNDALAREIALSSGYAPRQPEVRALFFFLTEQWQKYDELDFDQAMMRAIYEASQMPLRQEIAGRVQKAGRTDYLTILAGVDYRARAEEVTASEAELMIRVLAENKEYARLWSLAPELALPFSLDIIQILRKSQWRPESPSDQAVYDELLALAKDPIQLASPALARSLPLAIPRATVKVKGRINEVAFHPTQPILAIATSQRKVALWNFQTAGIERVLGDFIHSVGKVNYNSAGWLLCAERTNAQAFCTVSVFSDQQNFSLCAHEGTVTVLEPFGANYLLTAGRDKRVFVWDLDNQKKVAEKEYPFWARSAAISPDQQYAALLHEKLSLARLPDLSIVPGFPFLTPRTGGFRHGVAQEAAFSLDGKFILAGQHNGQVGMHYHTSLTQRPRKTVAAQHSQPVRGVEFLPHHPLVITAGAEGQVRFLHWPEMKQTGTVYAPEGTLTSLRISRTGAFMATGTSDASIVLWDLRVLDIPSLFTQPLATATHEQISTVRALSEYHSLPQPVRNGLRFLRVLLQYRFRYDIHVDEAPIIRFGEFDILLEEG